MYRPFSYEKIVLPLGEIIKPPLDHSMKTRNCLIYICVLYTEREYTF